MAFEFSQMILKQTLLPFSWFYRTTSVLLGLTFISSSVFAQGDFEQRDLTPLKDSLQIVNHNPKNKIHGAGSAIEENDFNKGLITSWEQLLQGKVAGVLITSKGGAPGSGSSIRIRGGTSLISSESPLIVLDGVPLYPQSVASGIDVLSYLNPADIASVTVLRDAAAISSYGIRTSAGVILITTKRSETGEKLKISFNSRVALSEMTERVAALSASEYKGLLQKQHPSLVEEYSGQHETNWQDQIFRNAVSLDNNLAFSGALKNIPYRFSVGHLKHDGILKTSGLKRSSAVFTVNPSFFNDHLQVNLYLRGVEQKVRVADLYAIPAAIAFNPTQPVYADNKYGGYFEWLDKDGNPKGRHGFSTFNLMFNPLSMLEQRKDINGLSSKFATVNLRYKLPFLPNLNVSFQKSYEKQENGFSSYMPATLASVSSLGGKRFSRESDRTNNFTELSFVYNREFSKLNSKLSLTGGYLIQAFKNSNKLEPTVNEEGNAVPSGWGHYNSKSTFDSFYSRLHYGYKERYHVAAALSRYGNSALGDDERYIYARSLAFIWEIGKENFMKQLNLISVLDFRVSYGLIPTNSQITSGEGNSSERWGTANAVQTAPYLEPEVTKMLNAGISFNFSNKFGGNLDLYQHVTDNSYGMVALSHHTGYSSYFSNIGSQTSKGIEAGLFYNVILNERAKWKIQVNTTYGTRLLTKLNRMNFMSIGLLPGSLVMLQQHRLGKPVYAFGTYRQLYDQQGKPIPRKFKDLNNDGKFSWEDLKAENSPAPKFHFGFISELDYKNWSLSVQFRGQTGNYTYNGVDAFYGSFEGYSNTTKTYYKTGGQDLELLSDFYLENASFVRLENLHLEHDMGLFFKEKVNLRLSAAIQNAFVLTKYSGRDPEVSNGIDSLLHYPQPRTFSLGLRLSI